MNDIFFYKLKIAMEGLDREESDFLNMIKGTIISNSNEILYIFENKNEIKQFKNMLGEYIIQNKDKYMWDGKRINGFNKDNNFCELGLDIISIEELYNKNLCGKRYKDVQFIEDTADLYDLVEQTIIEFDKIKGDK